LLQRHEKLFAHAQRDVIFESSEGFAHHIEAGTGFLLGVWEPRQRGKAMAVVDFVAHWLEYRSRRFCHKCFKVDA
jgi:hypothetical protein